CFIFAFVIIIKARSNGIDRNELGHKDRLIAGVVPFCLFKSSNSCLGSVSPHHTQDRAIEKALREKGGFIDGKNSPNLYRHRRIQSSIRYGVVSLSNDEVVSQ